MILQKRNTASLRRDALRMGIQKNRAGCQSCAQSYFDLAKQHGATEEELLQAKKVSEHEISRRSFFKHSTTAFATTAAVATSLGFLPEPAAAQTLDGGLGSFTLGQDQATVRAQHGPPLSTQAIHGNGDPEWHFPGAVIQFAKGSTGTLQIRQINIALESAGATAAGIHAGSSVDALKRAYGSALIDFGPAGLSLPLATTCLNFEVTNGIISSLILEDTTCATCLAATGPMGPGKGE